MEKGNTTLEDLAKAYAKHELLPYHRFGQSKYGFLGWVYDLQDSEPPRQEHVDTPGLSWTRRSGARGGRKSTIRSARRRL